MTQQTRALDSLSQQRRPEFKIIVLLENCDSKDSIPVSPAIGRDENLRESFSFGTTHGLFSSFLASFIQIYFQRRMPERKKLFFSHKTLHNIQSLFCRWEEKSCASCRAGGEDSLSFLLFFFCCVFLNESSPNICFGDFHRSDKDFSYRRKFSVCFAVGEVLVETRETYAPLERSVEMHGMMQT